MIYLLTIFLLLHSGCARLFGWNIHAPGLLSQQFYEEVAPKKERVALSFSPELLNYISTDRGGRFADPQTYYIGESYAPILIESFQGAFEEFIFMEAEPTPEIMKQYQIPFVAVVRIKQFGNKVTMKGQGLALTTETVVLDRDLKPVIRFETTGATDHQKIFAKKGGPEVNLNAALENNAKSIVQYLQDSIDHGAWHG